MGLEIKCDALHNGEPFTGKLYVDSEQLKYSGPGISWFLALSAPFRCAVEGEFLHIVVGATKLRFHIGPDVSKWEKKILHPPTLGDKLGLKPGTRVWLDGTFPPALKSSLELKECVECKKTVDANLAFLILDHKKQLPKIRKLKDRLSPHTPIWILYPKGIDEIKESDVMNEAALCGLGPSKIASFDDRLTAMRYGVKRS